MPVGMSEVSSCVIHPNIEPGHHVDKGEELGHFQFGGSTHCLLFRPGAIGDFAMTAIPQPHDPDAPLVLVRSRLATFVPKAPPRPTRLPAGGFPGVDSQLRTAGELLCDPGDAHKRAFGVCEMTDDEAIR